MSLFLSQFLNRIDTKGRVSVPAAFRAVLASQTDGQMGMPLAMAYVSLTQPCIEACGAKRFEKMNARIEALPPFSKEREALTTVLFGESISLSADQEGRVMLPKLLIEAAALDGEALFVGKGETFEIWQPAAYQAHAKAARALVAKQLSGLLGGGAS